MVTKLKFLKFIKFNYIVIYHNKYVLIVGAVTKKYSLELRSGSTQMELVGGDILLYLKHFNYLVFICTNPLFSAIKKYFQIFFRKNKYNL